MPITQEEKRYLETFYKNYLHSVDFKELTSIYSRHYSIGRLSNKLNDKFILISLVAFLTNAAKKKTPDDDPYVVLKKVLIEGHCDTYLKPLCILVKDLMYGCSEFDSCGCKSTKEIVEKINELYKELLPF